MAARVALASSSSFPLESAGEGHVPAKTPSRGRFCCSGIDQAIRRIFQKIFEWINIYFWSYDRVAPKTSSFFPLDWSAPSFVEEEIPPINGLERKTIHFHCGINNDRSSVIEGGECLHATLGKEFTVQPHWIHSANIMEGLVLVGLQKVNSLFQTLEQTDFISQDALVLPSVLLKNSILSKSIEYEAQLLSKTAQKILKQNNEKLKQLHVTFSNGGHVFREALRRLPPELRDTIVLITVGSTVAVEDGLACKIYNVIGDKDQGSITCNVWDDAMGLASRRISRRRISQMSVASIIGGHYFQQPQYQECIKEIVQTIQSEYEIFYKS